ncbi:MAG: hypothetical protein E6R03_05050 [Hyphomicrobiaceae bacterium]|nr:MAG: hypothetical protein E6R03_05050 [Hyphomicrobiaceae bacterium]
MSVMTKAVEVNVKSVDAKNFTVDADVSSESIDRDGEIILLSSWQKRLATYLANPLLCWMHPVGAWTARQPEDILGKSLVTEVQPTSLFCRFQYAVRENPKAEMCFNLMAGDYLRSYSIGAIAHGPVYSDYPEVYLNLLPEGAKAALKSGEAWCVHTDMELLEVSNVFVGSNRDALARACRDGVISKSVMPDIYKQINAKSGKQWSVPAQLKGGDPAVDALVARFDQLAQTVDSLQKSLILPAPATEAAVAEAETKAIEVTDQVVVAEKAVESEPVVIGPVDILKAVLLKL